MKLLTVIPARGGSRGIPKKNIVELNGKPLIAHTIHAALESKIVEELWVSTDCAEIATIAEQYSAKIIPRPEALAVDNASTESALIHAVDFVSHKLGVVFDTVLTLQPTSPLRKSASIRRFVDEFASRQGEIDALLTLHRDTSDFWVKSDSGYQRLYPNAPRRRQDRDPLFVENSCMYITDVEALRKTNFILGQKYDGFEIDAIEAIDINEPIDLRFAKAMLENTTL